jgi:hypothetical protein
LYQYFTGITPTEDEDIKDEEPVDGVELILVELPQEQVAEEIRGIPIDGSMAETPNAPIAFKNCRLFIPFIPYFYSSVFETFSSCVDYNAGLL